VTAPLRGWLSTSRRTGGAARRRTRPSATRRCHLETPGPARCAPRQPRRLCDPDRRCSPRAERCPPLTSACDRLACARAAAQSWPGCRGARQRAWCRCIAAPGVRRDEVRQRCDRHSLVSGVPVIAVSLPTVRWSGLASSRPRSPGAKGCRVCESARSCAGVAAAPTGLQFRGPPVCAGQQRRLHLRAPPLRRYSRDRTPLPHPKGVNQGGRA
jgi:hypothetical protein